MKPKSTSSTVNLNGKGRKLDSWIEAFVKHTDNLDSPVLFRRWAAITALASTLEQKVWLKSGGGIMFPNLYVVLVGHPGVGKTRTIRKAKEYLLEIPDYHIAPTSMTAASLIDTLVDSKRMIIRLPDSPLEYNSMMIAADELGAFVHKYDNEMIAVLSAFYDADPYGHSRRGKEIKIKIKSPQLNLLCGSTPSNLLNFIPEGAWDQGFTSRLILVFSDERIMHDDFAHVTRGASQELIHDLKFINAQVGEYTVTEDYRKLVFDWRDNGEQPQPNHPKLSHYTTRRRAHLYKLSMVSAIDRSSALVLTAEDFHRAKGWLEEVEQFMPDIFKASAAGTDTAAMEEIYHFVLTYGKVVPETKLINFMRERVPAHSVIRVLEVMMRSGMIEAVTFNKTTNMREWRAIVAAPPPDA